MLTKMITTPMDKGPVWALQHVGRELRAWLGEVEYHPIEDAVLLVDLARQGIQLTLTYELVQARRGASQNKPIAYFSGGKKNGV